MKLVTYELEGREKLGVLSRDERRVFPVRAAGIDYNSMRELIADISDSQLQLLEYLSIQEPYSIDGAADMEDIKLLAPIPRPEADIICIGKNYYEHAKESAEFKNEKFDSDAAIRDKAIYFSKRVNETNRDGGIIPSHSDITNALDYECELAVILRKTAYRIKPEEVKEYIFGYTIINDVSARDLQTEHKQWLFAKSLEGFAPLGPSIITAESVVYPPRLDIRSFVNGELRQESNTEKFIHGIDEIVSELSMGMRLKPGTVIATGTPAGVGMGFKPPKFLKPGDEVVCEIEGIGRLRNIIGD